jgi:FlaA1/EpsC-like NDP-sugar epimerase
MLSWNLRERSSLIYKLLHLIDCTVVALYLAALVTLYGIEWNPYYTDLEIITFVLCFLSFDSFQLYRSWRGWKYYREFIVICKAWGTVVGILLFYFFIFKISWAYSRAVFLFWAVTTPWLLFGCHFLVRILLRHFRRQGKNIRHAVIVGAGDLGLRMAKYLEAIPWAGIEVVGFFDDKLSTEEDLNKIHKPLLGRIDDLDDFLKENDIDYVYVALPMRAERKIFRILR